MTKSSFANFSPSDVFDAINANSDGSKDLNITENIKDEVKIDVDKENEEEIVKKELSKDWEKEQSGPKNINKIVINANIDVLNRKPKQIKG